MAVEPGAPVDDPRRLATVPLRLDPGSVAATPGSPWTALRMALCAAWGGLLVAAGALAVTLHGVLALSERRAEFVSAVTHELRTPLTTFRLYSEMLADGMVPDEEQRKRYLTTLCAESSRLGHLVENVLAYARLERGGSQYRRETLTLEALVQRVSPRLKERAELAGMRFVVEVAASLATQTVTVDPGVVEQILFNLVDNAAKYGLGESSTGGLRLEALPESGKFVGLRVRDEGRGISPDVVGRLFEPFHRSAEKAARSAPGVGLGLALSRKLSRSLGGDLRQDRSVPSGTAFVLSLATAA
jgi:signal transduction histidine kinase